MLKNLCSCLLTARHVPRFPLGGLSCAHPRGSWLRGTEANAARSPPGPVPDFPNMQSLTQHCCWYPHSAGSVRGEPLPVAVLHARGSRARTAAVGFRQHFVPLRWCLGCGRMLVKLPHDGRATHRQCGWSAHPHDRASVGCLAHGGVIPSKGRPFLVARNGERRDAVQCSRRSVRWLGYPIPTAVSSSSNCTCSPQTYAGFSVLQQGHPKGVNACAMQM